MRKIGLNFLLMLFLLAFFSSCLQNDNVLEKQTYEGEQIQLKAIIDTLIAQGNDVDTTSIGDYYITLEVGEGELAKIGDTLKVGYAGYFADGTIFDASEWHNDIDGSYEFILGDDKNPMIKGWDDGMKVMNKSAKIQLIVPSENAYGMYGSGVIPGYTTLIFVLKMMDIKPTLE